MLQEEILRKQLYDSYQNRALIYYLIFDELRSELGAKRAEQILSRAIYKRGAQRAAQYAPYAPGDLVGLKEAFVGQLPAGGAFHRPEVVRCDSEALDVKFHGCPLKEAWQGIGLPDEEVATLCRIAAAIDGGTFETAGFELSVQTWQPGHEGCCFLHLRPGRKGGKD